ncbi:MAG: PAS domain-containing protein, partial [Rhodospirillaceae bacterium]
GDLFARVHAIWEGLAPGGWTEERFFALDGEVLSRLFLVGVERAPARYRYRFVGTELCDLHGQDYAGVYLHEMRLGEVGDAVAAAFDRVVAERAPMLLRGAFVTPQGTVVAERLLLPLPGDGRDCDAILGALAHHPPAGPGAPGRRAQDG